MLKKCLVAIGALIISIGFAFAQVDVNKADQAALEGIKGVGPSTSKKILDERKKNGNFKDWNDLKQRVKGIGEKSASKLSQSGLTVNNQSLSNAPALSASKSAAKDMKSDAKAPAKKTAPTTAIVVPNAIAPAVAAGTETSKDTKNSKSKDFSNKMMAPKSEDKSVLGTMPTKK